MDKKQQASKTTNEVSVAIAEASATEVDGNQPHTPRRRGRPRKNKIETNMEMKTGEESQQVSESQEFMKKAKSGEVEEEVQEKQEEAKTDSNKGELVAKKASRSRARKKGKPRKSC